MREVRIERRTRVEGVRRRGNDQRRLSGPGVSAYRDPHHPPAARIPHALLPWHISLSLSVLGSASRSVRRRRRPRWWRCSSRPLPLPATDSHSKKKNEKSENLSWGSNPKVRGGAEQRLVAMEDGSRSAAFASESPTTSLSSSSSKAIRLPLRGITAGEITTTTTKQNQAKFWHGSFRVLGGAESKRYLLSLPLSLSLCLSVCLSF